MNFSIHPIDFDSGLLSKKVGSVQIHNTCFSLPLEKNIIRQAKEEGYTFISIKSGIKLETKNFYFVGELLSLSANIESLTLKLNRFPDRFPAVPLEINNFIEYSGILHNTQKTRFSTDPMIPEELVRRHKFKMLETYQRRCPELTRGIFTEDNKLASLLTCYKSANTLNLYEIIVDKKYLQAIMGIQLIKSIVGVAQHLYSDITTAQTAVYRDNLASLSFFNGLGFDSASSSFFYHYWIQENID